LHELAKKWGGQSVGESERREQLIKAHYLRARTRLARLRIEPARADLAGAIALDPPEATGKLLRQLQRDIDVAERDRMQSNKKIAKEVAKFAEQAMAHLSEEQIAAMGTVS